MAEKMVGQEIGRKLSVQSFGWDKPTIVEAVMKDKESEIFLARFVGVATGVKPYENDKGDVQYGLIGDFEGTGPDGEIIPGSVLYMPAYVTDQIASILERDTTATVDIAHDQYAHFDADAATMYVFTVRSLIKTESPRVAAIKAQLQGVALPSLPAPKK